VLFISLFCFLNDIFLLNIWNWPEQYIIAGAFGVSSLANNMAAILYSHRQLINDICPNSCQPLRFLCSRNTASTHNTPRSSNVVLITITRGFFWSHSTRLWRNVWENCILAIFWQFLQTVWMVKRTRTTCCNESEFSPLTSFYFSSDILKEFLLTEWENVQKIIRTEYLWILGTYKKVTPT